jgi:4-hydroxy-tetrahydrodipicolinate synthase
VDEPAFRRHLKRLGDAGISVFVGGSGSGRAVADAEERDRILTTLSRNWAAKFPFWRTVEPRTTRETLQFVRDISR